MNAAVLVFQAGAHPAETDTGRRAMRVLLPMLALASFLAACSQPREIAATAPSVSYQVAGNDLTQANANAARFCQQYGTAPRLQTVQPSGSGNVATYVCGR